MSGDLKVERKEHGHLVALSIYSTVDTTGDVCTEPVKQITYKRVQVKPNLSPP